MKFVAQAGALDNALSLARVLARGNKNLVAVLIEAGDTISIRCTDDKGNATITAVARASVAEPGEATISCDRLAALASSLADNAMVEISTDASGMQIVSGNSRSRLAIIPPAGQLKPLAIAEDKLISQVEIAGSDIFTIFGPLVAAERSDSSRFYLASVFLHNTDDGKLAAVGTNGVKLLKATIEAAEFARDRTTIVPSKSCSTMLHLLQKAKPKLETTVIRRSKRLISFTTKQFCFTTRLIDAEPDGYPRYEVVIPAAAPNKVFCNRLELLSSLARLSAVSTSDSSVALVALSWADSGPLDICLARQPLDGADTIAAEAQGDASVALSLPQLAGLLEEFHGERISLETSGEQPIVIRGGEKLGLLVRSRWDVTEPSISKGQRADEMKENHEAGIPASSNQPFEPVAIEQAADRKLEAA